MSFRTILYSLLILLLATTFLPLPTAQAEALSFQDVLQQSIDASLDLKMAELDRRLSETDVMGARADYFPTVKAQTDIDYLDDLTGGQSTVTTVGTTVLPSGTRFQNAVTLSVNQTLFDFGARGHKVAMAKKDVLSKREIIRQTRRDIIVKLVDIYADALSAYTSIKAKEAVLPLYQQVFQMKQRLFTAGKASKVDIADEAIQVAQTLHDLQTYQDQFRQKLNDLSYFTKTQYNAEQTQLQGFDELTTDLPLSFQPEQTPEYRSYALQIAQKKEEMLYQRRQAWPSVSFYGSYSLYGFNKTSWPRAWGSFQNRLLDVGVALSVPIFDGLKNHSQVKKLELQIDRLQLERQKKLEDLQHEFQSFQADAKGAEAESMTQSLLTAESFKKMVLVDRLSVQQLIERSNFLKAQADWVNKHWEIEQRNIKRLAARKKLVILAASS